MIIDIWPKMKGQMPVILQSELSECGLACLTMIANYYGKEYTLGDLRRKLGSSMRGCSMSKLLKQAGRLQLQTRPLNADVDYLHQCHLPAILHWNLNHFVVLERVEGDRFVITDPAKGRRTINTEELSKNYTGVLIEVRKEEGFEKAQAQGRFGVFTSLSNWRGVKKFYFNAILLSLLVQILSISGPFLIKIVTDSVVPGSNISFLVSVASAFFLLALLQIVTTYLRSIYVLRFSSQYYFKVCADVVSHLVKLPLPFFQKRDSVNIAERVGALVPLKDVVSEGVITAVIDGAGAAIILGLMIWMSPGLTAVALGAFTCYAILRIITFSRLRSIGEQSVERWARWRSHLEETIRGIAPIRIAGQSTRRATANHGRLAQAINTTNVQSLLALFVAQAGEAAFQLELIVLIGLGGYAVMVGDMTLGLLFSFLAFRNQLNMRLRSLVDTLYNIRFSGLHTDRLADVVLEPALKQNNGFKPDEAREAPAIAITDVSFRYDEESEPILQRCNLIVKRGEFVSISGASGQGKSTLLKVILGLEKLNSGTISVYGTPVETDNCSMSDMSIAAVLQDDQLFVGSIADNISFFDEMPDHGKIVAVAKATNIYDDIMAMPMGFASTVGEGGSALSGGQRQRILLARALYQDPQILLLDEATAHLDTSTEKEIIKNLAALDITILMVTHRPEALALADRCLEFQVGRLKPQKNSQPSQPSEKEPQVTETEVNAIKDIPLKDAKAFTPQSDRHSILVFGLEDCEPCVAARTILNEIGDEFPQLFDIYMTKFPNGEREDGYAPKDFNVQFYPTCRLIAPDGTVLGNMRGIVGQTLPQQYALVYRWLEKKLKVPLETMAQGKARNIA